MAVAVSVGLFLAIAWPLGSYLGLWGVGLAMSVANLGAVVYLAFLLHRRFRIHLSELWGLEPGTVSEIWQATAPLNPFIAKPIP
jgi:O-antigen/teichoic acid export membrane protein